MQGLTQSERTWVFEARSYVKGVYPVGSMSLLPFKSYYVWVEFNQEPHDEFAERALCFRR
jgi:hypothetical protein